MTAEAKTFDVDGAPFPGVTPAVLRDLAAPTPAEEIKTRKAYGKSGVQKNPDGSDKELSYVDARFVQERLDDVVGPENWQDKYEDTIDGIRCGIGINVQGQWVWKWDVGIRSNIEAVKGAHSDAYKRAAVKWGIARDLYEEREHQPEVVAEAPIRATAAAPSRAARYAPRTDEDERMHDEAEDPDSDWVCPIHGDVKLVPAGVSKKTNKPYKAFLACPEYGCDETFRP